MRKLYILFFILISFQFSKGQSKITADNEKLLEYYQTQQYNQAVEYLKSIYKEDTLGVKETTQMAYANLMAGNLNEAESGYLMLYTQQPQNLPVLFSLADLSTRLGKEDKARIYYTDILKIDSANLNGYKLKAYKELADLNKGKQTHSRLIYLKKAHQLDSADASVVSDLCELYFKADSFDKAKEILLPALKADSSSFELQKMKMPISIADRNYFEAVKTGETLLNYGDSSAFVYKNLAKAYFLTLDYQNALKCFLILKDKSPESEGLFYNIGLSYKEVKDHKNAIAYFEKAINEGISPKIAAYYGLMGDSYENTGKYKEANEAYKKGLLFENSNNLLYKIALVYETRLNDKKNAINFYEQFLKTIDAKKNPRQVIFIKNKIADLKK